MNSKPSHLTIPSVGQFREGRVIGHSNSTSRLFAQRRGITEEPIEEVPKRFASTEGRFSIIDEKNKDSSEESDQDSPLPIMIHNQKVARPNFSKSVDYSHPPANMTSASRFRIVPVESRYKRGRWNCFDFYDKEAMCSKSPKISCPGPSPFKPVTQQKSVDRPVRSMTEVAAAPNTAPPSQFQQVSFNFDVSSDSDRENAEPAFSQSQRGGFSKDEKEKLILPVNGHNPKTIASVNDASGGRMTPSELLQTGLETTLKTEISKLDSSQECALDQCQPDQSCCTSSNNNGSSPAMVAIDSKIEQAMDLVKTHLMFAVREEVEVLRAKIVDLESHIHHLEAENSVLKDHIPDDLLSSLNLGKSK